MQENTRSDGTLIAGAALLGGAALLSSAQNANAQKVKKAVTPALTFKDIDGSGDTKVLNYALSLEALEANLYQQAVARLTALGADSRLIAIVTEFGKVEQQHRDFLITNLGNKAITSGSLSGASFEFGIASMNATQVLDLVISAENTGVGAYLGAITRFKSYKYLQTAAAIQGTEARHTAALVVVRNQLFGSTIPTAPAYNQGYFNKGIDVPVDPDAVLAAVSGYIVFPAID